MTVRYTQGDITRDPSDLLVCTVNTIGIMGKGVAKSFATTFPTILRPYREACATNRLVVGGCMLFPLPEPGRSTALPPRLWSALATKEHWIDRSRLEWVERGLYELYALAARAGVRTIALPPPGCGNGRLEWADVYPLVMAALSGFDLTIYADPPSASDNRF